MFTWLRSQLTCLRTLNHITAPRSISGDKENNEKTDTTLALISRHRTSKFLEELEKLIFSKYFVTMQPDEHDSVGAERGENPILWTT